MSIYIFAHKDFGVPIGCDNDYRILNLADNKINSINTSDLNGYNIHKLNVNLDETTGMYWVWKNTVDPFIGTCHYRRYFLNPITPVNERGELQVFPGDRMEEILDKKDAHVFAYHSQICGDDMNIFTVLRNVIENKEAFYYVYGMVRETIGKEHPDYLKDFDAAMESQYQYRCNMMITRRSIYDAYCKWLFSIILPVTLTFQNIDAAKPSPTNYNRRIPGYFCEALFSTWLTHWEKKGLKVVPIEVYECQ